jgi:hypothetical protein
MSNSVEENIIVPRGSFDLPQTQLPSNPPTSPHTVAHVGLIALPLRSDRMGDGMTEHQSLYTLPSYNEQMLRRAEGRDLSEADLYAISRRLGEVMRAQRSDHATGEGRGSAGDK